MADMQLERFSCGFYEESIEDRILLTYIEMIVGNKKAERGNLLKTMALNYLKTQKATTFNELKSIVNIKEIERKDFFSLSIEDKERKKRLENLILLEKNIAKENYVRDSNRIKKILSEIEEIWEENSDWRFGQLLTNIGFYNGKDIFYIEDEVLEDKLKKVKNRFINNNFQDKF